jgi:hypothetical protein
MYGGKSIAHGSVGGVNPMSFIILSLTVVAWFILILDGQLKSKRGHQASPEVYYNHHLSNINDAQKHYEEVYSDKLKYINEIKQSLITKKDKYPPEQYDAKITKLNLKQQKAAEIYAKQKQKIAAQKAKLNAASHDLK